MADRTAIVTGSSTGLGFAIARAFIQEGANVAMCGRDSAGLANALSALEAGGLPTSRVLALTCDVADEGQVKRLTDRTIAAFGTVDILVNNAGILGPIGRTEDVELAQWRAAVDTNFFGVLHCCRNILPLFRKRNSGKIINVSGGGATSPRPFFSAYATSKAAVVRLTENLSEELRDTGIDVNAIAPGPLNTRMLEETLAAGIGRLGEKNFGEVLRQKQNGGSPLDKAADLCVYLASSLSDGITGRLISAPWDEWPSLHEHVAELRSTDIYTLRRIVPADREVSWT